MKNIIISQLFDQMADIMEILGENRFRINTYRQVSRIIADLPTDVEKLLSSGELKEMPGIGESSLAKIEEFVKTGEMTAYKHLSSQIPSSLLDLLRIPGLGPRGAKAIYEELKVKNIADLKKAIESGHLAKLHGFGEKKAAAIAKGITFLETATGRIRLDQARVASAIVTAFLNKLPEIKTLQPAGSLRRCSETVGDVDILVISKDGQKIADAFTSAAFVTEVLAAGPTKSSAIIDASGTAVHVDVRVVPEESFGAASQYFTGSKQHNVRLREIALKAKLKLNEYGLFKGDKMIAGADEEDIYSKLGLDYVDPLLRENRGEIEAAIFHKLPQLIKLDDIKGDFHIHTNASDGNCDIHQMAEAAIEIGYKYICITDHSKSSAIANGLSSKQLAEHIKQIRKVSDSLKGITLLAGCEVDILADGSMDFDDKLLADLDFVIASIHSALSSPREKVTARTLKAMDNPYVTCIGHPTGRLIGKREPMDIDINAMIKHAADTGTFLELNANPYRLDLKDVHCKMAIEAGVTLVLGTDAHSREDLGLMPYGVATAARGWAEKRNILNTHSLADVQKLIRKKRPR